MPIPTTPLRHASTPTMGGATSGTPPPALSTVSRATDPLAEVRVLLEQRKFREANALLYSTVKDDHRIHAPSHYAFVVEFGLRNRWDYRVIQDQLALAFHAARDLPQEEQDKLFRTLSITAHRVGTFEQYDLSTPALWLIEKLSTYVDGNREKTSSLFCIEGQIFDAKGRLSYAKEAYEHAIAADSSNTRAYGLLAESYKKTGKAGDAIPLLIQALSGQEDAALRNILGQAYLEVGNREEALIQFHENMRRYPNNAFAYFLKGKATLLGRYDESVLVREEIKSLDGLFSRSDTPRYNGHEGAIYAALFYAFLLGRPSLVNMRPKFNELIQRLKTLGFPLQGQSGMNADLNECFYYRTSNALDLPQVLCKPVKRYKAG